MSWLEDVARTDQTELHEAALLVVEAGIVLSAADWLDLGSAGRAAVIMARRAQRVRELEATGQDLAAAHAFAGFDGGVSAARLMARAAAEGAARALRAGREEKTGG